ncbi:transcription termination/antitermination NusG family protein [Bradyrhizobium sp. 18BD]
MTTKLAKVARPYWSGDPRIVRLADDVEGKWAVVEVRSREVETELQRRHFGIYVPRYSETVIAKSRKVLKRGPMFPGYVFVFLWSVPGNYGRLASIEGASVVGSLNDEEINLVQAVENGQRWTSAADKKRLHHNKCASTKRLESCMVQLRSIDAAKRNQALRRLLGLPSTGSR